MRKTVLGLAAASLLSFGVAQSGGGQSGGTDSGGTGSGGMQSGGAATEPGVAAQSQTGSGLQLIEARNPGTYIADAEGSTLYTLVDDNGEILPCEADCLAAWPPFTGPAAIAEGMELDPSLVGTTQAADGSEQVTYNSYPLYYFVQDTQPGALAGQGIEAFGGFWYIIGDNGEPLESDPLLETGS